jgi:D-xylose transport system substrate-binding protein
MSSGSAAARPGSDQSAVVSGHVRGNYRMIRTHTFARWCAFSAAVVAMASTPLAIRAADKPLVGMLISDFTTSARWKSDVQYFQAALAKLDPDVEFKYQDATTDQTKQQTQAAAFLTSGAKVLVDVPVDATQASAIVRAAHDNSPPIPVVAYDRLIKNADVDAYVTFDPVSVGRQQAQYIVDHVKSGTIISIAGAQTDNNAIEFHRGAMEVLDPLVKSGRYKLPYDEYTPNWDSNVAQAHTASELNNLGNKVDAVLVANDGMASGVIAALRAQHLDGKVLVTGQDATVAGLQNILTGQQNMTIYKPIRKLAEAAATVTDAFLKGQKPKTTTTMNNGKIDVPTILLPVVSVTKANIKSTVIADGFVTKETLCNGIPAAACSGL